MTSRVTVRENTHTESHLMAAPQHSRVLNFQIHWFRVVTSDSFHCQVLFWSINCEEIVITIFFKFKLKCSNCIFGLISSLKFKDAQFTMTEV